ncbi:hypothetical protein KGF54_001008 [Candida jiufengensis]|uniref:uncharacterized protein n=1 Tax=Candida jiufengensis TaxID=497108 RepID=UPI0022249041|nr:uncharacterized protein KGF54_001008 [Candida jiufengensis]KAI5956533.1 hypothetical protein KGF54_001008 [Candida jiufengensis]
MSNYQQQKLNQHHHNHHHDQHLQQQQQQQQQQRPKYGPPHNIKPRQYNIMLEMLETQSNKKLTEEYQIEFLETLSNLENQTTINSSMIDLQPEVQWFMRPFLIDFLIELHSSFKLQPQTLFLCMNIIDRYCAKRIVFKRHYQLVGCTALWIAGKYEDKKSRVPTLKELTIMCRNAYDEEMFVQMEMHILSTLEWSIGHPTLEDCLQLSIKFSNIINSNLTPCKYNHQNDNGSSTLSAVTAIGRFLCELSLYDKFFLNVPVSLIAITSNLLACSMLQIPNASLSLKNLIEKHIIDPKRNQLREQHFKQQKQAQQQNHQNKYQQHQEQFKIPKFPPKLSNTNMFYSQNNESNYSHQSNNIMRHSSIDDDIDLDFDYEETDVDEVEEEEEEEDDDDDDYEDEEDDEYNNEFNDTHNTTFDEDIENKSPKIIGSFLNGFDESSLITIKKIAMILIINLNKVTEVLTKKYEDLGVIQVLRNFHLKNSITIQQINDYIIKNSTVNNNNNNNSNQSSTSSIQSILDNFDSIDSRILNSIESLINFPKNLSNPNDFLDEFNLTSSSTSLLLSSESDFLYGNHLKTPKSPYPFTSSTDSIIPPITPPSATSQYSVFSNKRSNSSSSTNIDSNSNINSNCNTPINYSVNSFIGKPDQQQQSIPSLLRTKSKIRKKGTANTASIKGQQQQQSQSNRDGFSPIKPVITTNSSLSNSSPLMHQHF